MIKTSVLAGAYLLAASLCALPAGAATSAPKTAEQYAAEAKAYEAQAETLLQSPLASKVAQPRVQIAKSVSLDAKPGEPHGTPRVGVYGCMNQNAMEVAPLQWGIIDAHTYSTYDGARGRYSFDIAGGILTFESGPFKGLKRKRTSEMSFRVLDDHGALTGFNCPWEPKSPTKLHW